MLGGGLQQRRLHEHLAHLRELHRVGQQVEEDLLQAVAVAPRQVRQPRVHPADHLPGHKGGAKVGETRNRKSYDVHDYNNQQTRWSGAALSAVCLSGAPRAPCWRRWKTPSPGRPPPRCGCRSPRTRARACRSPHA
eukprot:8353835-Pyramimonas_sp.AAC.2